MNVIASKTIKQTNIKYQTKHSHFYLSKIIKVVETRFHLMSGKSSLAISPQVAYIAIYDGFISKCDLQEIKVIFELKKSDDFFFDFFLLELCTRYLYGCKRENSFVFKKKKTFFFLFENEVTQNLVFLVFLYKK